MKKLTAFISTLCILNILVLAGLVGFLFGSGRLDKPKAQAIADILRQPGTPVGFREKVYDLMTPAPATAPGNAATQRGGSLDASGAPANAAGRIDFLAKVLEEQRLRLENEAQDLRHRQELLVNAQSDLDSAKSNFENSKKKFQQETDQAAAQKEKEAFDKMMALMDGSKPKQIKDLLMAMPSDQGAKYFGAMDPEQATKVMAEFKSPEEKAMLNTFVDTVRGAPSASGTSNASKTKG